jgi:6-phospho-beta-glucosidase
MRTPLLLAGLLKMRNPASEIALFDIDQEQADLMRSLGCHAISADQRTNIRVAIHAEDAIKGSDFVVCAIRPGGMKRRAADERAAVSLGFAGQETTGPAGSAMAWRNVGAVMQYVRLMEVLAPNAWLINFTNPAGLVTQAVHHASSISTVGICDTPAEIFHRIAEAFHVRLENVQCEYFGLNHLGFVRRAEIDGQDRMGELLADETKLSSLYPAPLFPPALIRQLGLIPTEYVFFYLRPSVALLNQNAVGRTRGEELVELNDRVNQQLRDIFAREGTQGAVRAYQRYMNHRNESYLQLEGAGASAAGHQPSTSWNPFDAVTGYHRIAVEVIEGLSGAGPRPMVLNIQNEGTLAQFADDDVVEVSCIVEQGRIRRVPQAPVPATVSGLLESTKGYERTAAGACLALDRERMIYALTQYPLIGDWDRATKIVSTMFTA